MDVAAMGQAAKRARAASAPIGRQQSVAEKFKVTRKGVSLTASSVGVSIFWPQIIKVAGRVAAPLGGHAYYRLRSTDHASGAGGIYMESGPSPLGPWTERGLIYVDSTLGSQTETPRAVYVPALDADKPWFLYYQNAGAGTGQQQTLLAKTADFQTFTRVGVVLDVPNLVDQPGDGHCGYFTPRLWGSTIVGPSLRGGSLRGHMAWNESYDGVSFFTDPVLISRRPDLLDSAGRVWLPHNSEVIRWRGELIAIGKTETMTGVTPSTSRIVWVPVADDLRTLLGRPQILFEPTESYETTNPVSLGVYAEDDRIVLTVHYDSTYSTPGAGATGSALAVFADYELRAA